MASLRLPSVDLDTSVVDVLLADNLKATDCKPGKLFLYPRKLNSSADWPSIWPHRTFLTELVTATCGRLLRQARWEAQLGKYLDENASEAFAPKELARASYAARKMLSHLWYARRDGVKPPGRYAPLGAILAKFVPDATSAGLAAGEDSSSEVEIVQDEPAPSIVLSVLSDVDEGDTPNLLKTDCSFASLFDQVFGGSAPLSDSEISESNADLASATPKRVAPLVSATPEKVAPQKVAPLVSRSEIAELLKGPSGSSAVAPTPLQYKQLNAVLKRPAAAGDPAGAQAMRKRPACASNRAERKREHSKLYHGEMKVARQLGLSHDECKARARIVAARGAM